jgi:hypothetical protein
MELFLFFFIKEKEQSHPSGCIILKKMSELILYFAWLALSLRDSQEIV